MADFCRIMTYNIHGGLDRRNRPSLEGIGETIAQCRPALVGLQETERGFRARAGFGDQPLLLSRRLGMDFRFATAVDRSPAPGRGKFGNAVLSSWPILGSWRETLPSGREPRVLLCVRVENPQVKLHFLVCHLGLDFAERARQIEVIVDRVRALRGPVILAGDFNAKPDAPELAPLFSAFAEVQTAAGSDRPTFIPAAARIDYVFIPRDWRVRRAEVLPSGASDHCPLVADVEPGGV